MFNVYNHGINRKPRRSTLPNGRTNILYLRMGILIIFYRFVVINIIVVTFNGRLIL